MRTMPSRLLLSKPLRLVLSAGLLSCLLAPGARATEGDASDSCLALIQEHGAYLAQDRTDLADKVSGRARDAGCFDKPANAEVCAALAEQEQQFNLAGRMDLVNIVRGQERALACISAKPQPLNAA